MTSDTVNPDLVSELRNGLTVIIGHCDMLEDACSTQVDSLGRIKSIKAVALRMANRISQQTLPDAKVTHRVEKRRHTSA